MFVRATTITSDPARIDEGVDFVRNSVVPAVNTLPGCLGLSMFVDRENALVTVSTAYTSEQTRAEADTLLTPLRAKGTRILGGGTPVTEFFELAVIDRLRPAEPGFWSRLTRVTIEPTQVDEAVDAYTSSTLNDVQLLPGYCSAVLLIDRQRGMGLVSVTFDSLQHLVDSRTQGEQIREVGLAKAGAEIVEVRESEIVIAGIRLPQTG
jgi:hypothetical protein